MAVGCYFIFDRRLDLIGTNQPMIKDNQLHMVPRICAECMHEDAWVGHDASTIFMKKKCPTNICMSITIHYWSTICSLCLFNICIAEEYLIKSLIFMVARVPGHNLM